VTHARSSGSRRSGGRPTEFADRAPALRGPGSTRARYSVALELLLPGESTEPIRHNSTQIGFCIRGGGSVAIADRALEFARYDVWNHPAWATYAYRNHTRARQVRLTDPNAALLEQLDIHLVENRPPADAPRVRHCRRSAAHEPVAPSRSATTARS
jgi:gentisate 1,2-dioxygenase